MATSKSTSVINIVAIGTLDTKLDEFLYLRSQILEADPSIKVILIDVGRSGPSSTTTAAAKDAITITQSEVYQRALENTDGDDDSSSNRGGESKSKDLASLPRSEVVNAMIRGATIIVKELFLADGQQQGKGGGVHGIVALGGSGGTSIAAGVMRALPLALPKLIVSTVASGDTASYVGESDIAMMYSVVDIAGLNDLLRAVVRNAAFAIAGMARGYYYHTQQQNQQESSSLDSHDRRKTKRKRAVGITMFGVTTPAADVARRFLEARGLEVYVFHATGAGGRALERLVREHRLDGILDLTTTELADELVGGVMSAGPDRLTAAARAGIPQVVSVGALDMVNYGPRDTLPNIHVLRNIYVHNPSVTLVRTTPDECDELGQRLAARLKENCADPAVVEVWLPLKGVSALAVEGQVFCDGDADEALFRAIRKTLDGSGIVVKEVDADINDPSFAESLARRLFELMN
ncbi:hypothetical protein F5Y17DRAFT_101767 [Xylariaceae sp. FL0594]|nr:hypothetical protein F5Y17DRAFT_101767 [Xylariaceae sp. FL0594]